jgi:hypothetical protein
MTCRMLSKDWGVYKVISYMSHGVIVNIRGTSDYLYVILQALQIDPIIV